MLKRFDCVSKITSKFLIFSANVLCNQSVQVFNLRLFSLISIEWEQKKCRTLNAWKADFCQSTGNKHKRRISTNVVLSYCVTVSCTLLLWLSFSRSTPPYILVYVFLYPHFFHSSGQLFWSGKVSNTRFYVVVCVKCFVCRVAIAPLKIVGMPH